MTSEKKLLLTELRAIINNDQYLNESIRKTLIDNFFSSDIKGLVESISNVSAALIKDVADSFGTNHSRDMSEKLFRSMKITHMLNWPLALPFLNGINDALGLGATIDSKFSSYDGNSKCLVLIDFSII